jgi:hypothetical protein
MYNQNRIGEAVRLRDLSTGRKETPEVGDNKRREKTKRLVEEYG